jgi:hypothetical protein
MIKDKEILINRLKNEVEISESLGKIKKKCLRLEESLINDEEIFSYEALINNL